MVVSKGNVKLNPLFFCCNLKYGKIKEIRLVPKTSASFAYIEYEIEKSAERSLELNGKSLDSFPGRSISVAISDPSLKK